MTVTVVTYGPPAAVPGASVPLIIPDSGSICRPSGRPSALEKSASEAGPEAGSGSETVSPSVPCWSATGARVTRETTSQFNVWLWLDTPSLAVTVVT